MFYLTPSRLDLHFRFAAAIDAPENGVPVIWTINALAFGFSAVLVFFCVSCFGGAVACVSYLIIIVSEALTRALNVLGWLQTDPCEIAHQ